MIYPYDGGGPNFRQYALRQLHQLAGLGDVLSDAQKKIAEGKASVESAKKTLQDVKDATSVLEDIALWFSSWSGGKITAPHISKNLNPVNNKAWKATSGPDFLSDIAEGAEFGAADYKHLGLHPVNLATKPAGDGYLWNFVSGTWYKATDPQKPITDQLKQGKTTPYNPTQLQLAQQNINGWANYTPGQLAKIDALIAAGQWGLIGSGPTAQFGATRTMSNVISALGHTRSKVASDAGLMVTAAGPYQGQSWSKVVRPQLVNQAVARLKAMPTQYQPANAGALLAMQADPGGHGNSDTVGSSPTKAGGGAAEALGIGALVWFLMRFMR